MRVADSTCCHFHCRWDFNEFLKQNKKCMPDGPFLPQPKGPNWALSWSVNSHLLLRVPWRGRSSVCGLQLQYTPPPPPHTIFNVQWAARRKLHSIAGKPACPWLMRLSGVRKGNPGTPAARLSFWRQDRRRWRRSAERMSTMRFRKSAAKEPTFKARPWLHLHLHCSSEEEEKDDGGWKKEALNAYINVSKKFD